MHIICNQTFKQTSDCLGLMQKIGISGLKHLVMYSCLRLSSIYAVTCAAVAPAALASAVLSGVKELELASTTSTAMLLSSGPSRTLLMPIASSKLRPKQVRTLSDISEIDLCDV